MFLNARRDRQSALASDTIESNQSGERRTNEDLEADRGVQVDKNALGDAFAADAAASDSVTWVHGVSANAAPRCGRYFWNLGRCTEVPTLGVLTLTFTGWQLQGLRTKPAQPISQSARVEASQDPAQGHSRGQWFEVCGCRGLGYLTYLKGRDRTNSKIHDVAVSCSLKFEAEL